MEEAVEATLLLPKEIVLLHLLATQHGEDHRARRLRSSSHRNQ